MKDLHWVFIFAAIFITPFLPSLIKSKCPGCRKRALQSLETLKLHAEAQASPYTYVTLYRCEKCHALFKRIKSGNLESSSADEHNIMGEAAIK